MGKWYKVRVRVEVMNRAREYSSSFHFFYTTKFAYMVTVCIFEFCYKWHAIRAHAEASSRVGVVAALSCSMHVNL